MKTMWEVVERGEGEDVKKVWKRTERSWTVDGWSRVGWKRIEQAFKPIYNPSLAYILLLSLIFGFIFSLDFIIMYCNYLEDQRLTSGEQCRVRYYYSCPASL